MIQLISNAYFETVPHRIVLGAFLGSGQCPPFYDEDIQGHEFI